MNIHEYQAKELFANYNIPVPAEYPAFSPDEAKQQARNLGGSAWMVKAQVHAGGRGKAGGVKLAHSLDEVASITENLLGTRLVTHQTNHNGKPVQCVLIASTVTIVKELYLSLVIDRARQRVAVIASNEGGVEIEQVAVHTPDKIVTRLIDPIAGIQPYQCRDIAFALGLGIKHRNQLTTLLMGLYRLFLEKDLNLVEINPLIINDKGDLLALDAKITIDDNALYRHADLAALYDASQEDEKEHRARQHDLSYVALEGDIACMVNGAGLAMATMDMIKIHGGEPANFLDVRGGTNAEKVAEAFKLIASDPHAKAILINIFGGIVKCDLIAQGVIKAMQQTNRALPVVVRLAGTREPEGKALLQASGLPILTTEDLDSAVQAVVKLAKGVTA